MFTDDESAELSCAVKSQTCRRASSVVHQKSRSDAKTDYSMPRCAFLPPSDLDESLAHLVITAWYPDIMYAAVPLPLAVLFSSTSWNNTSRSSPVTRTSIPQQNTTRYVYASTINLYHNTVLPSVELTGIVPPSTFPP